MTEILAHMYNTHMHAQKVFYEVSEGNVETENPEAAALSATASGYGAFLQAGKLSAQL